jgi:hypothetical protein
LYRSREEQERLIELGLSQTRHSKHMVGLAVDLALIDRGKAVWDMEAFRPLGEYWESLGGVWGGRWKNLRDGCHFEL